MWNRIKGQVLRGREDKDEDENNTIISRALLKFYAPEVPPWLSSATPVTDQQQPQMYQPPQMHQSTESRRTFDRSDRFSSPLRTNLPNTSSPGPATPASPADSKPKSGLASRLKNSHW